jgi:hypothetical protein
MRFFKKRATVGLSGKSDKINFFAYLNKKQFYMCKSYSDLFLKKSHLDIRPLKQVVLPNLPEKSQYNFHFLKLM